MTPIIRMIDPHYSFEQFANGKAPWMILCILVAFIVDALAAQVRHVMEAFMDSDWAAISTIIFKALTAALALGYAYYGFRSRRKDYHIKRLEERKLIDEEKKRNGEK